ncbi:Cyclin-dependent protein kinase [Podochytrium sp. JEL0797]|nr:Cyclin-dependent protein kinase [Podochytrium sp. JEL0797]
MTSATAIYDALNDYMGPSASTEALAAVICETITSHIPSSPQKKEYLKQFAGHVLRLSHPTVPVLLAALTYIDRYFSATSRFNEQDPVVHYRLFFIALLTAYKYVCERAVSNLAWESASDNFFTLPEINAMERSFLNVLQYDLVCEDNSTQGDWLETAASLCTLP